MIIIINIINISIPCIMFKFDFDGFMIIKHSKK